MSAEDNIAKWAKDNYPGYVLRQYREQDQTAGMLQLEIMMLDPNFWQYDEEGIRNEVSYIPKEEYWEQLDQLGFSDPDFIVMTVDKVTNKVIGFEIR